METLLRDLKLAVRRLARRPAWTLNALMVLVLGLGAAIILYSVLQAVILQPLPFDDADRLVKLMPQHRQTGTLSTVPYRSYVRWRDGLQGVEEIAVYRSRLRVLEGDEGAERLTADEVSPSFFAVLGVRPLHGRPFVEDDFLPGAPPRVIIDAGLWRRRFGAGEDIIGRRIQLDGEAIEVVGVMDRQFDDARSGLLGWHQLWMPLQVDEADEVAAGNHGYGVVGRLASGVGVEALRDELDAVALQLEATYPDTHRGWGAAARTAPDLLLSEARDALQPLSVAVCLLLLIACINVAHLFLAQAPHRHRTIAICRALGASRWRLLRQLWSESFVLAASAAGIALLLAVWAIEWIPVVAPADTPRLDHLAIDRSVLLGAFLLTLLTSVISSLAPAFDLRGIRAGLPTGQSFSEGRRGAYLRQSLVASEVALALILILGTGLMLRSLWQLRSVDPGFDPQHMMVLRLDLPPTHYTEAAQRRETALHLQHALADLSHVDAAGLLMQEPPLVDSPNVFRYWLPESLPPEGLRYTAGWFVSEGYQRAMGLELLEGRWFKEGETLDTTTDLVINGSLADNVWPDESAVGRYLMSGTAEDPKRHRIIGVVRDVAYDGPGVEPKLRSEMYAPWGPIQRHLTVVARGTDIEQRHGQLLDVVRRIAPGAPVLSLESGDELMARSLAEHRFVTQLLSVFAALALALAAAGLYGVLSYQVSRRRREIGLRMALGAGSRQMARMITGAGLRAVAWGVVVGILVSLALHRPLATRLYGVEAGDLWTYGGVIVLLFVVAWFASWWPARRAARTDPATSLRWE